MSLKIIKPGLLDSIQDMGRHRLGHLGINPGGAMDMESAWLANLILGNDKNEAVLEMHFPAAEIHFNITAIITLTGADFEAILDGREITLNTPIRVEENSVLQFNRPVGGARCYLAVMGGLDVPQWLGSTSTNLKAGAGGWKGRPLKAGDQLPFKHPVPNTRSYSEIHFETPSWLDKGRHLAQSDFTAFVIKGNEWDWITKESQDHFLSASFSISNRSDRMGYRLEGPILTKHRKEELISSPVTFGTVQLLPEGNLILLMADHQTTGGYPRIAHVITAHLPRVAQMKPSNLLQFQIVDIHAAEELLFQQTEKLLAFQRTSKNLIRPFFEKNN